MWYLQGITKTVSGKETCGAGMQNNRQMDGRLSLDNVIEQGREYYRRIYKDSYQGFIVGKVPSVAHKARDVAVIDSHLSIAQGLSLYNAGAYK